MKSLVRCCLLALISSVVATDRARGTDVRSSHWTQRSEDLSIDFSAALKSPNPSPNAIVSRSKVLPDRLDGTPLGDPGKNRSERG